MQQSVTLERPLYFDRLSETTPSNLTASLPKNPGMTPPQKRDKFLTVDQERAAANINAFWVLTKKLKLKANILDVGCGSGNSTFHIAMKAHKDSTIVGVDTQENADFAEKKYAPCAINQNLSFKAIASIADLPKDRSWNLLSALAFFSWVPINEHTEILKHMYGVLADKGEILVRSQAVQERPYRKAAEKVMQKPEWNSYFMGYTPPFVDQTEEGFGICLTKAGFCQIETATVEDNFIFPDKAAMCAYFRQWLPEQSRINGNNNSETKALRKKFVAEVIDQYCLDQDYSGTNIPLIFPAILATAKKRGLSTSNLIRV